MTATAARGGLLRHIAAFSNHRSSTWLLAAIAFADSSCLPIPPDILLVPMILMRPERMRLLVIVCTIASTLGAAVGYLIGSTLWRVIGQPLIEMYGYVDAFNTFQHWVAEYGFGIIVLKAFTPIPFKIAAIAAGAVAMDPSSFMLATVLGRGVHFAMVAALLVFCGPRLMVLISRYERKAIIACLLLVVALVVAFHFR
jgi:membrane protein YqaA with SNARE-associated domain